MPISRSSGLAMLGASLIAAVAVAAPSASDSGVAAPRLGLPDPAASREAVHP